MNGIQEVSGSIPLISTKRPETEWFQVFYFLLLIALFVGAGLGHILLSEFEPLRLIAFLVLCLVLGELFYQIDQRIQSRA